MLAIKRNIFFITLTATHLNMFAYLGARRKELRSPLVQQAPAGVNGRGTPLDAITVSTTDSQHILCI
jgi:hypothetical protein